MTSQQRAALATANRRRLTQRRLCSEIRALQSAPGAHLAADVLLNDTNEDVQSLLVQQLVLSVRKVGPARAVQLLNDIGVVKTLNVARLCDLTGRQRQALADELKAVAA